MRIAMMALAIVAFTSLSAVASENAVPISGYGNMSMETFEGKVLKVYAAENKGARFRAYVVKWNNQEVVVSDDYGTTDKKEGDTIKFVVQQTEMPDFTSMGANDAKTIKCLQFSTEMEYPSFDTSGGYEKESAVSSLRTISTACECYRAANTPVAYPSDLKALSEANPPYIDKQLGSGTKSGYKFIYTYISPSKYTCVASPENSELSSEKKTYFVDETGVIRLNDVSGPSVE
jgi:hypothetical protein